MIVKYLPKVSFTTQLAQKLWKPDTYFENAKETAIHKVTMPNMLLRVHTNGDILYMMRYGTLLT